MWSNAWCLRPGRLGGGKPHPVRHRISAEVVLASAAGAERAIEPFPINQQTRPPPWL
jgi:hypothetical protein